MSDFTIIIKGPNGIILDAEIDASLRHVRRLSLDDAALKALLIVTSVMAGTVEGELIKDHQRQGPQISPIPSRFSESESCLESAESADGRGA